MLSLSKGTVYALIASLFFALMNVCVKLIPDIPAIQIIFFRSLISLILSLGYLRYQKVDIRGNRPGLLALRGLLGTTALICYFTTLQYIPLASAVTIQFLAPIFTTIFGMLFFRERVYKLQWVALIISFLGVLMIKGFDPNLSTGFFFLGLSAAVFSSLAYSVIRKLNTTEHPVVVILYFPLVALPVSGIFTFFYWVQPDVLDWGILLLIGLLTQTAQYFMTLSYQQEEISRISNLRFLSVIYALLFGFVLFEEIMGVMTLLGIFVVLLGVLLNILTKQYAGRYRLFRF